MTRLRCLLGWHRFYLLYRDRGEEASDGLGQYVPEVICIHCGRMK